MADAAAAPPAPGSAWQQAQTPLITLYPKEIGLALLYSCKAHMGDGQMNRDVYRGSTDGAPTNPLFVVPWYERTTMERMEEVLTIVGPTAAATVRNASGATTPMLAVQACRPDLLVRFLALPDVDLGAQDKRERGLFDVAADAVVGTTVPGQRAAAVECVHTLLRHLPDPAVLTEGSGPASVRRLVEADALTPHFFQDASAALKQCVAAALRQLMSAERNPPHQRVIDAGWLPFLVSCLGEQYDGHKLQFEAAWALTNVASGTSVHTKAVVEAGALPALVRLLRLPPDEDATKDTVEQAVWALGNIAGDSPASRDLVLAAGALDPVIDLIQPTTHLSLLRHATWTVSNLCRGKPAPDFRQVGRALPTLAAVIYSQDQEILTDALWAIAYLSDGPNTKVQAVLEAGVLGRVVELLAHPSSSVLTPALRTVGNIATGDDAQTQALLDQGVLPHLNRLLGHTKKAVRKEACWTVSNMMAGTQAQIQAVIDAGCITRLVSILAGGMVGESDVRKEATWAICNGTQCGTRDQIAYLVKCGIISLLAKQLNTLDVRLAAVVAEAFENILKAGARDPATPATDNPYVAYMQEADVPEALLQQLEGQTDVGAETSARIRTLLSTYFDEKEAEAEEGTGGGGTADGTTAQQSG